MKPIKVAATLVTGEIATYDLQLPLDSLLAWSWMMEHHPDLMEASQAGINPGRWITPELPLERREAQSEWYWAASCACGAPVREITRYWNKRFDQQHAIDYADLQGRSGKVLTSAGFYKARHMPLIVYLVPRLTWYAVGDEAAVRRLIERVHYLGKKRSQGLGRVASWTVEPWAEDLSHLRPIPNPEGDDFCGIRPPYWERSNQVRARWPNDARLAYKAVLPGRDAM